MAEQNSSGEDKPIATVVDPAGRVIAKITKTEIVGEEVNLFLEWEPYKEFRGKKPRWVIYDEKTETFTGANPVKKERRPLQILAGCRLVKS